MTITQFKNTARAAFKAHRADIASMHHQIEESRQLGQQFKSKIADAEAIVALFEKKREDQQESLAAVAFGELPERELAVLAEALVEFEDAAKRANQSIAVARAGLARIERTTAPLHAQLGQAVQQSAALELAARIEMAEEYLPAYKVAAQTFAEAHSALTGCLLFVDELSASEHQSWVRGALHQESLEVPLPRLPSVGDQISVKFNLLEGTAAAQKAAAAAFKAALA